MYDRAPNAAERLEMTYRYFYVYLDQSESNMIGNYKNLELEKRELIEVIKSDQSRIYFDLSKIQLVMYFGNLKDG
jgi:hypothetical protein